jgi:RimJ/RimL family protein N-acetyltransferase
MNPDVIRGLYADEFVQYRYADSSYYGYVDSPNVFYLAAKEDDQWLACAMCIFKNMWDIEVHLCIPENMRRRGYEFATLVIDWLYDNSPINRISTTVVALFPQVGNFALKLGFEYEGTSKGACYREGEFIDLHNYGLLRGKPYGRRRR